MEPFAIMFFKALFISLVFCSFVITACLIYTRLGLLWSHMEQLLIVFIKALLISALILTISGAIYALYLQIGRYSALVMAAFLILMFVIYKYNI